MKKGQSLLEDSSGFYCEFLVGNLFLSVSTPLVLVTPEEIPALELQPR
jgi:hypothetical protein